MTKVELELERMHSSHSVDEKEESEPIATECEFDSVDLDSIDGVNIVNEVTPERVLSCGSGSGHWIMWGQAFPRSEVRFFAQVFILYIVIITCLVNLSIGKGELTSLWISLLSSCIGYILPSPYISRKTPARQQISPDNVN